MPDFASRRTHRPARATAALALAATTAVAALFTAGPAVSATAATLDADSTAGTASSVHHQATTSPQAFDLQAHRGGRGEHTESSAAAFRHALELGVSTLELDIVLTADGVPLVWHDPSIQADKCRDTAPVTVGDPQYPYVGKDVHDLTAAQISTLRCDLVLDSFPDAVPAIDNTLITLDELFEIAAVDPEVHFNIETKLEAEDPSRSAEPEEFVDAIIASARKAGTLDRIMVQSFDWRSLPLVHAQAPEVPLVALVDETTWVPGSEWTGDIDYGAVGGDVIAAVQQLGAQVLSPSYTFAAAVGESPAELVEKAHARDLKVVPWTVNESKDMTAQIDAGVDGIITDYPSRLKKILDERGISYR